MDDEIPEIFGCTTKVTFVNLIVPNGRATSSGVLPADLLSHSFRSTPYSPPSNVGKNKFSSDPRLTSPVSLTVIPDGK